jgi:hypothetical protein
MNNKHVTFAAMVLICIYKLIVLIKISKITLNRIQSNESILISRNKKVENRSNLERESMFN